MANVPATEKKLNEARFFYGRLEEQRRSCTLSEEFDYYLSAFLSAARSVAEVLEHEQGAVLRTWLHGWEATLPQDDQDFLTFCRRQRNAEVHKAGPAVTRGVEYISVMEIPYTGATHPAYHPSQTWSGPPGVPPPQIAQRADSFSFGGTAVEVGAACGRYLALVERLVSEFQRAHP